MSEKELKISVVLRSVDGAIMCQVNADMDQFESLLDSELGDEDSSCWRLARKWDENDKLYPISIREVLTDFEVSLLALPIIIAGLVKEFVEL